VIAYDGFESKFILLYQYNQKHISLRSADNLFDWSQPSNVVDLDATDDQRLFYPSLAGTSANPARPGKRFYIYYLERGPGNHKPRLMRTTITVQTPLANEGRLAALRRLSSIGQGAAPFLERGDSDDPGFCRSDRGIAHRRLGLGPDHA
jgi:hypothetical protein